MPKIVLHGVTYTADASALTTGSSTITQSSGILESKAGYVRATGTTGSGTIVDGVFKIFSGDGDPDPALGQNGDIYLKKQTV